MMMEQDRMRMMMMEEDRMRMMIMEQDRTMTAMEVMNQERNNALLWQQENRMMMQQDMFMMDEPFLVGEPLLLTPDAAIIF